jgi:hypothetical protein
MKTKEQWINETMDSLDGIQPATGDPLNMKKIMQQVQKKREPYILTQRHLILQIAAGLTLLISVNIFSLLNYNGTSNSEQTLVKTLATEYFSYMETIKL